MGNQARTKEHQQYVMQLRRSGATMTSKPSKKTIKDRAMKDQEKNGF